MKLLVHPEKRHAASPSRRRQESGMAVIVVMALIAILLIYVSGNARTLHLLGRDVKLVEQQQLRRLAALPATNRPPASNLVTNVASLQPAEDRKAER